MEKKSMRVATAIYEVQWKKYLVKKKNPNQSKAKKTKDFLVVWQVKSKNLQTLSDTYPILNA